MAWEICLPATNTGDFFLLCYSNKRKTVHQNLPVEALFTIDLSTRYIIQSPGLDNYKRIYVTRVRQLQVNDVILWKGLFLVSEESRIWPNMRLSPPF